MKVYPVTCPCKGCTVRELGCHENCNRTDLTYAEWKASGIEQPKTWVSQNMTKRRLWKIHARGRKNEGR